MLHGCTRTLEGNCESFGFCGCSLLINVAGLSNHSVGERESEVDRDGEVLMRERERANGKWKRRLPSGRLLEQLRARLPQLPPSADGRTLTRGH